MVVTAASMETADVVLMDSNLGKMPLAINIGRAIVSKIRENMMMVMVTKGLMLAFTTMIANVVAVVGHTIRPGWHALRHIQQ
jgi:Cd2+/Zn2+-exporting ATPase